MPTLTYKRKRSLQMNAMIVPTEAKVCSRSIFLKPRSGGAPVLLGSFVSAFRRPEPKHRWRSGGGSPRNHPKLKLATILTMVITPVVPLADLLRRPSFVRKAQCQQPCPKINCNLRLTWAVFLFVSILKHPTFDLGDAWFSRVTSSAMRIRPGQGLP